MSLKTHPRHLRCNYKLRYTKNSTEMGKIMSDLDVVNSMDDSIEDDQESKELVNLDSQIESSQEEEDEDSSKRIIHSGEIITFPVRISVKDMYVFMMRHGYLGVSGVIGVLISIGAFVMLVAGMDGGSNFNRLLLIVASALFTIINPLMMLFKAWKQITLVPIYKADITYTFSDAGAEITQGEEWVTFPWDSIYRLRGGQSAIYVYTSSVRAFILPYTCCENQFQELKAMMKRHTDHKQYRLK